MSRPTIVPLRSVSLLIATASALGWATSTRADDGPKDPDPARFAESIRKFEQADRADSRERGGVLFIGSSSIGRWDLPESFPDLDALNRGFGGSQLSDVVHYADRVIRPHRPRLVVVYAGDNDIAAGKSADRVHEDFLELAGIVREAAPEARLLFLAIKPSPSRIEKWPEMSRANDLISRACDADDRLEFVDVASPMLGPDGAPRPELYVRDRLHLSDLGYEVWADTLGPLLDRTAAGDRP